MMTEHLIIGKDELEAVKDSTLFYPCCGNDLMTAIELFSPYIIDFWFVDKAFFSVGQWHPGGEEVKGPADQQLPLLRNDKRYKFIDKNIEGPPYWTSYSPHITPCILTESYIHVSSGRKIRIHRRRGYGVSAFRKEIKTLGVFFYRGDSCGEGGSGSLWLKRQNIHEVCDKLINKGLFVSDGSDGAQYTRKGGVYGEIYDHRKSKIKDPEELIRTIKPFVDDRGHHFRCVGYAGVRYGPTMIWQVTKPE